MAKAIECGYGSCSEPAAESHWAWNGNGYVNGMVVCADHVQRSKDFDHANLRSSAMRRLFLYLPIVQPVVGSEQAIAMEVALHAACRLLRTQADATQAERDEAEQTLALLRQTQAEAWERVHGRAA